MDKFYDYFPWSDRKTDPFYTKKCLKSFSKKPLLGAINGKAAVFIIVKTNNKRPPKRYRKRCPVGELELNVPYSMNKKYRFKTMQPADLVQRIGDDDGELIVHEQIISNLLAKNTLKSKYYTSDTMILNSSLMKTRDFGNTNTLIQCPTNRKKGITSKRGKELNQGLGERKDNDFRVSTIYTISKCPTSSKSKGQKARICRRKRSRINDQFDDYSSEPDFFMFTDDVEAEAQRCFSKVFPIQEFICQRVKQRTSKGLEKNQRIKIDQTITSSRLPKICDIPKEISSGFQFETLFGVSKWKDFDFMAEAEKISRKLSEGVKFSWLTSARTAFTIRVFAVGHCSSSKLFPALNITLQLGLSNTIIVNMDGNFAFTFSKQHIERNLCSSFLKNLQDLVQWCLTTFGKWNTSGCFIHYISKFVFAADRIIGNKRIEDLKCYESIFEYQQICSSICDDLRTKDDEELILLVKKKHDEHDREDIVDFEVNNDERPLCLICELVTGSGKAILNCDHNVCVYCLRLSLVSQLRADVFPLRCPCMCAVPFEIVKCLLHIPLFIFYIRRSLKNMELLNNRETACCPACLKIGTLPSQLRYNILRCTSCLTCFCSNCGKAPHWPINCEEAQYWIKKFKQTETFVRMQMSGELRKEIIVLECFMCKKELKAGDQVQNVRCSCFSGGSFNCKTGELIVDKYRGDMFLIESKYIKAKDISAKILRRYAPVYSVNAKYCKLWYEARQLRCHGCSADFSFRFLNENASLKALCTPAEAKERKTMTHYLSEFGWIWLYVHRKDKITQWKEVRVDLRKMLKLWNRIEGKLKLDILPEFVRHELQELLASFDRTVQRLISNFQVTH